MSAVEIETNRGLLFPVGRAKHSQTHLARFSGVHRRFERLGCWHGAEIVDDYAHHPTEVAATLAAARQVYPRRRIHAVFQPHLYSRTRDLAADFGRALLAADRVVVTDVYASRERPIAGVTGELVAQAVRSAGHARVDYCPDWRDAPERLAEVSEGDVVLTLGAGDIYRLGERLAAQMRTSGAGAILAALQDDLHPLLAREGQKEKE